MAPLGADPRGMLTRIGLPLSNWRFCGMAVAESASGGCHEAG